MGDPTSHAYTMSQVVPFSDMATGAKVPDSYSFPTSTLLSKTSTNFTGQSTGGNQYGSWMYSPYEEAAIVNPATVSTAGVLTWNSSSITASAVNTALNAIAVQYRPVGGGVRLTTNTSLTSASGYVWVMHMPLLATTAGYDYGNFPTGEAQMAQYPLSEKYTFTELAERPLVIPFRKVSDLSLAWHPSAAGGSGLPAYTGWLEDTGWCGIFLFMNTGQTSTAVSFNGERLVHLEYVPGAGSTYYGFGDATPEPLNRPVLDRTVNVGQATPIAYVESDDPHERSLFSKVVETAATIGSLCAGSQSCKQAVNVALGSVSRRIGFGTGVSSYIGADLEMGRLRY